MGVVSSHLTRNLHTAPQWNVILILPHFISCLWYWILTHFSHWFRQGCKESFLCLYFQDLDWKFSFCMIVSASSSIGSWVGLRLFCFYLPHWFLKWILLLPLLLLHCSIFTPSIDSWIHCSLLVSSINSCIVLFLLLPLVCSWEVCEPSGVV